MTTFETLQREVGTWSEANFGDQPAVNPLLGVGEELGELVDHLATRDGPTEHERDCVGDALVYLADFCHRRGVDLQRAYADGPADGADVDHENPLTGAVVALGRLHRSVLKRRQGIRLEDPRVGDEAERRAVAALLCHLDDLARDRGYTLDACVRVAWYDEVADREWESSYVEDGGAGADDS